jgi:predicted AlkP superfamily phosphohydrolase/phosphomutase
MGPELEVFMEPVGADPYAPLVPLSAPRYYAGFLADRYGRFRTTGRLVDESAFACGVMGPASLLRQTYVSLEEQERMTLGELGRPGWDLLVSVFTQPAPALTVFSRAGDPSHPAHDAEMDAEFGDSVEKLYVRIDGLVSEIMKALDASDRLLVVGVCGSGTVTRELNLNAWLVKKGYLVLDRGMRSSAREGFGDVDWSATRAYAAGAGGVYLNIAGREPEGSVAAGREARDLLDRLLEELAGIRDGDKPVVRDVIEGARALGGAAGDRVPDLLVLLEPGYGIGAAERRGTIEARIIQDSVDRWYPRASGAGPSAAGGVVLSTFLPRTGGSLLDVAPTVLSFLGLKPVPVHTGRNLW